MIRSTTEQQITWVTLDRPERLNAFTPDDYGDLRLALDHARGDDSTNVVVLTGAGRAFSAGADRSLLDPTASDGDRASAGERFSQLLETLRDFEKPLIAAVNGLAVGFGCTLLLYCDIVLAAESARFRLPFTELGIVPEAGSTALLLQRARWDDAMWVMLSSDWFDASRAQALGLVWDIVPDEELTSRTTTVAASLAVHDSAAVIATKRLMTAGRAEAARLAAVRELDEMTQLRRSQP